MRHTIYLITYPILITFVVVSVGNCSTGDIGKPHVEAKPCQNQGVCRDCDCDTICDQHEGAFEESDCDYSTGKERDFDGDGTPDYLDEDSDGDEVPDIEEAGDKDLLTEPCVSSAYGCGYLNPNMPNYQRKDAAGFDVEIPDTSTADVRLDLQDGSGVYQTNESLDTTDDFCDPIPIHCLQNIEEGDFELCDGLDNDCDGEVDEMCDCRVAGKIQSCFLGPPDFRKQGVCQDGIQVCRQVEEFIYRWGPCEDNIPPSDEMCDGVDNNCNGCVDEIPDCLPAGECPGPNDPRIPDAKPFVDYPLNGEAFYYKDDIVSWHWEIKGSPCDRLFQLMDNQATAENGTLSYTLYGADQRNAHVMFSLSGAYQLELSVNKMDGTVFSCSWIIYVRAPGLRVELCWDKTGRVASQQRQSVDLDLHLGKTPGTNYWFSDTDCYQRTCRSQDTPWDFAHSRNLDECTGQGAPNYQAYHDVLGYCPNPRLDIDNKDMDTTRYITENINLDNPDDGDRFRVMVEYYTNIEVDSLSNLDAGIPLSSIETHPLVNVYCDGKLKGSYGGIPDPTEGESSQFIPVQGFDTPGKMWRVVDITILKSEQFDCSLIPIEQPDSEPNYFISEYDQSYP